MATGAIGNVVEIDGEASERKEKGHGQHEDDRQTGAGLRDDKFRI